MELRIRQPLAQFCECPNGNVETLMPLQPARKNNDWLVPRSSRLRFEDIRIDVVDEDRTFVSVGSSRCIFFKPQVIGQDHVIRECGARFFHQHQRSNPKRIRLYIESVRKQLRNNVVDVENHRNAGQFRIPCSKDQKIRDVMNVDNVIGLSEVTRC